MKRFLSALIAFIVFLDGGLQLCTQPVPPSTVMPPVRYVSVHGQRMAYYDLSNGPVLVLVHGFGTSAAIDWAQVIRPLAKYYRVIAIDNIGFGLSDKPNIAYTTQTFVDFLAGFLRELGITHFSMAGESLGGADCGTLRSGISGARFDHSKGGQAGLDRCCDFRPRRAGNLAATG